MITQAQDAFVQGFMAKCAEYGIDSEKLIKRAADSPLGEFGKALPGNIALSATGVSPVASLLGLAGEIKGYTDPDAEYGELSNWVPGQTQYNWSRRNKRVAREMLKKDPNSHPYANIVAERLGHGTSTLAAGGIGALLGALLDKSDRASGAWTGAQAGLGAAGIAAAIAAIRGLAKRRRTDDEQLEKETKARAIAKYLIPGLAVEDSYMRLGKSRDYFSEGKKSKDKSKDKSED